MNELTTVPTSENVINKLSEEESKDEILDLTKTADQQKPIPRHQNKMVAEKTTDMYFSGLMSE